ncbi:MBL fold metallo-hydrolase [Actinoplanes sp. L3-i22]|uniref:MBL fold metallo-hydrolase n=1 Tax=Actinoplanes sp. L3-i22 TaxID=2836373 RepID=UPI001C7932AC|nr:MBL fold metallo-hydrolase [Actinoplanes sp. L3-i22]BCY08735.1 MBL fold hydrolase [Actinoplanes sp. L3-i22]
MVEPAPISQVQLGGTTVIYLPDGVVRADPLTAFPDTTQSDWDSYPDLFDSDGRLVVSVGSFLIRNDAGLTLIDLGLGRTAAADSGQLLTSLSAEHLSPADIDVVLFTHMHRDHVGWAGAFHNARHIVDEREWNYWQAHDDPTGPDPATVLAPLAPAIEFFDGRPPVPGIRALPTPGHTPGHTSFLVTDPATEEKVLILGDAIHTRAQLENFGWRFRSDYDSRLASRVRTDLLHRPEPIIANGHFSGSVFGRADGLAPGGCRSTDDD